MSRQLPPASALALGWGVLLASFAGGHLSGVPAPIMWPALLLLGSALVAQGLVQHHESGAGPFALIALGIAALLGPLAVACVAMQLGLSRQEQNSDSAAAAVARGLLATGLGLSVLLDACAGRSVLGQIAFIGEREIMLTDLHQLQWLLLCVPAVQMGLAAAIAGPQQNERVVSDEVDRRERLPLWLTGVAVAITLAAAFAIAWDAPWRMRWGGHIHVREHAVIGLSVFASLRLLVVVAEHPSAPRLSGVQASTVAATGVLAMLLADSFTLALPMLVGALVVGRSARAVPLRLRRGARRSAHRDELSRRSRSAS